MRDTVKQVGANHVIERTVDRQAFWLAQTPQAFRRDWLLDAHRKAHAEECAPPMMLSCSNGLATMSWSSKGAAKISRSRGRKIW